MNILHTSDWHLGQALYGRRRHDEFRLFLDWLADTLRRESVDVLLVPGDIFDSGEWFWLGYNLFREGKAEEGHNAYDKVEAILSKEDAYRLLVPYARKMEEILASDYKDKSEKRYLIGANAEEYRLINNNLCFWNSEGFGEGYMNSIDRTVRHIFRSSSRCDGKFFADISLGETFSGTDGATLSFVSDSETVETPCGKFENCQLWITKLWDDDGKSIFRGTAEAGTVPGD